MQIRVGQGYDSHTFGADRALRLAGVEIPHPSGLTGHSDGDAVAHAVTDAILGAAGLGDIGQHFPDTAAEWAGADSIDLLTRAASLVREDGWRIMNTDVTVLTQTPRIGPHVPDMRRTLAGALGLEERAVSIKGKTNEGMDAVGRGEGLVVFAVALVSRA